MDKVWIKNTGKMPEGIEGHDVEVKFRNGGTERDQRPEEWIWSFSEMPDDINYYIDHTALEEDKLMAGKKGEIVKFCGYELEEGGFYLTKGGEIIIFLGIDDGNAEFRGFVSSQTPFITKGSTGYLKHLRKIGDELKKAIEPEKGKLYMFRDTPSNLPTYSKFSHLIDDDATKYKYEDTDGTGWVLIEEIDPTTLGKL